MDTIKLRPADEILRESEAFFMREGKVHHTLKRLTQALEEESIPYAILGGMALNLFGYTRETVDVDILLTQAGLERFKERLVGRGYVMAFEGASKSFRDAETQVKVEALITGEYPGDGKPKPVSFPDPASAHVERDGYRVISLEKLIELKLASGMSAPHRLRDLADVQDLISALDLPLELEVHLDESVREEYRRLWESVQGKD
ncbi:MAG: nucleotidyltransferase family protein [Anaerolineales bacterium]|nr:nucleotidyltransferase family protein [Anaerolineales bacterium]